MSTATSTPTAETPKKPGKPKKSAFTPGRLIAAGVVLVVLILMFFSTKILTGKEATGAAPGTFSPQSYAQEKFSSEIAPDIVKRAADLAVVQKAIAADPAAAAKKYGVVSGSSPAVYSVKFTGTAGELGPNGQMPVTVEGVPSDIKVLMQMGPAINGTAVRDATGKVQFSQFKNQIDYQNVGAELNKQVKDQVLANVDPASLAGKKVAAVGAFSLINPSAYIITPVQIEEAK
jgi:predicted lipoprotein